MNRRSGEQTKEHILVVAREVFTTLGYGRASVRAIAEAAGVSVGCLYIHFENKEALYGALMARCMTELARKSSETIRQDPDPAAALRSFIAGFLEHARSNRAMILLQGRELGLAFGIEMKQRLSREMRQTLTELIRQGIAQGIFRPLDAEAAAKAIFTGLRGYVVSMMIDDDALFPAETFADLALYGLVARGPATIVG